MASALSLPNSYSCILTFEGDVPTVLFPSPTLLPPPKSDLVGDMNEFMTPFISSIFAQCLTTISRNNKKTDPSSCPVCGQSVRPGDLDSHFIQELEKLYKISSVNRCRRTGQFSSATDESLENRWEAYLRIKSNRHCRMRMKSRKKKTDDVVCPICNENVYGNMQQLNNHVEICLRKHGTMDPDDEEEEETVDVEGDTYDNYQWSPPPRVPPIRLSGVENHSAFHKEDGGEQLTDKDEDSSLYGPVQYSETDVTNSELNPSQVAGPPEER